MARALAGLILLLAAQPVFAQPGEWDAGDWHRHHGNGARILVLRDYHLASGQTARGPIIVLGGAATIDGHADDDVVVLGGRLRVGPQAVVDGEVVTVGHTAEVDPQAKVHGGVNETVVSFPDIDGNWNGTSQGFLTALALAGTIVRLFAVFAIATVLTLLAPNWVRQISWRAGEGMASAAAIGVACQIVFFPVLLLLMAVLAVSIVGIPLIGALPFLVVAVGVAGTAGFTAVAARIGARLRGTTVEDSNALWIDMLLGMAVVSALTLFARFAAFGLFWTSPAVWSVTGMGLLIEYAVWTIGIGAACATMLAGWKGPRPAAQAAVVV
jgi:hypothetical protein